MGGAAGFMLSMFAFYLSLALQAEAKGLCTDTNVTLLQIKLEVLKLATNNSHMRHVLQALPSGAPDVLQPFFIKVDYYDRGLVDEFMVCLSCIAALCVVSFVVAKLKIWFWKEKDHDFDEAMPSPLTEAGSPTETDAPRLIVTDSMETVADTSDSEGLSEDVLPTPGLAVQHTHRRLTIHSSEDVIYHGCSNLQNSIISVFTLNMITDFVWLKLGTNAFASRSFRILSSAMYMGIYFTLQGVLLVGLHSVFCQARVANVRHIYNRYETLMYGNHVVEFKEGMIRGIAGNIVPENYLQMSDNTVLEVCQISIAHPVYIFCVLIVWVWFCLADVRYRVETTIRLMYCTPTVASADKVFAHGANRAESHHAEQIVQGLTLDLKIIILFFSEIPSLLITVCLFFVGSMWLLATNKMEDILLNALALEFMLLLKRALFEVVSDERTRIMVEKTKFAPLIRQDCMTSANVMATTLWGIVGIYFVYWFTFFGQNVLPHYNWDIRPYCYAYGDIGSL